MYLFLAEYIIFFSDKDKKETIELIAPEIILEYAICGIWYIKLKLPLSIYIVCIVASLKNKEFTVKYNEKLNKNRHIFIDFEL